VITKVQDRYKHRESKAPVVEVEFGYDMINYAFLCDAGNGFIYTAPIADFLK
jgi:hypothetical protein